MYWIRYVKVIAFNLTHKHDDSNSLAIGQRIRRMRRDDMLVYAYILNLEHN